MTKKTTKKWERPVVEGSQFEYAGHHVEARYCGPDLLCYVDGAQVGHFYINVEATRTAGRSYIDELTKKR